MFAEYLQHSISTFNGKFQLVKFNQILKVFLWEKKKIKINQTHICAFKEHHIFLKKWFYFL